MKPRISEVGIIGGGPSACATAIQLKRCGVDSVIFERNKIGGLLLNARMIENYPGFPEGISGEKLTGLFEQHLMRLNVRVEIADVVGLHYEDGFTQSRGAFLLNTVQNSFRSRIVVLASGTKPKELKELEIPEEAKNRVVYEIYPILGNHHKRVTIVGSGDCALDYALSLARLSDQVVILNRSMRKRSFPRLWQEIREEKRIAYEENVEIAHVSLAGRELLLKCTKEVGSRFEIFSDYLVVAIGRIPQTDYISTEMREKVAGLQHERRLYFVGDVKRGDYRQTAIAVGDGIYAAMKIYRMLREGQE
nr:MAG: hypothetical protein AM324_01950 [Candidatus Thorarchaeota archaeon SMTZ1-83]